MSASPRKRLRRPIWAPPRAQVSEAGDTLIEILVSVVIMGICVVALLGALTTSVSSSAQFRSLTTTDTVLKNFADAIKFDIQGQNATNSLYSNCATTTTYQLATEYPTSAQAGAGLTVLGTNFTTGDSVGISIGPTSIPANDFVSGQTVLSGGKVSATVILPSVPGAPAPRTVNDGVLTATSATIQSATASFSQNDVGSLVSDGDGDIPPEARIVAVINGQQATISAPATGSATGDSVTIGTGTWPVVVSAPPSSTTPTTSATTFTVTASLGAMSAASGPAGTTQVTVPVTGFLAQSPLTVTVGGIAASPTAGGTTTTTGSSTITFTVPASTPVGSQSVVVSDGIHSATSTFVVTTTGSPVGPPSSVVAPPAPAVAGYTVGITAVAWWNDATLAWDSPPTVSQATCQSNPNDDSGLQMITIQASAPNYVTDTLSVVVSNPSSAPPAGPSISWSSSPSNPLPDMSTPLVFSATLSSTWGSTPSGWVSWSLNGSPGSLPASTCPPTSTPTSSTATSSTWTCSISGASVAAGTYQVAIDYSGNTQLGSATSSDFAVVAPFSITGLQLLNPGGTTGTPNELEKGDSIVISFSAPVNVKTFCGGTAWPQTGGIYTLGGSSTVLTVSGTPGPDDDITVSKSSGNCTALNIGTIDLGTNTYLIGVGNLTFSGASASGTTPTTLTWNTALTQLTISFGTMNSGFAAAQPGQSSAPFYTAPSTTTDTFGDQLSNPNDQYPTTPVSGPQF